MKYQYKCEVRAEDFFLLSMHRIYHSMAGVCNLIFTVALILLTAKFWKETADLWQILMILGCILFPVIQPIEIYIRSKRQVAGLPKDLELGLDEDGLHVMTDHKKSLISWNKVQKVVKEKNMLIIFSDASHGYMLTDRVVGDTKASLYAFVEAKIEHKNK